MEAEFHKRLYDESMNIHQSCHRHRGYKGPQLCRRLVVRASFSQHWPDRLQGYYERVYFARRSFIGRIQIAHRRRARVEVRGVRDLMDLRIYRLQVQ